MHPHLGRPWIALWKRIRTGYLFSQPAQIIQGQISYNADLRKIGRAQALLNSPSDPRNFQRIQAVEPGRDEIYREQMSSHHQKGECQWLACQLSSAMEHLSGI